MVRYDKKEVYKAVKMRKNLICIFLLLSMLLCLLSGCVNSERRDHRKFARSLQKQLPFIQSVCLVEEFSGFEDMLSVIDISLSTSYMLITDCGDIYRLGKYSDGVYFRKIESDVKAKKFYGACIVSEDNRLYEYNEDHCAVEIYPVLNLEDYLNISKYDGFTDRDLTGYLQITENKEMFITVSGYRPFYEQVFCATIDWPFEADERVEYIQDGGIIKTDKRYYWVEFIEQGIEFDDVVPTYSYQLHTLDLDETNIARIFCRGSDGTTFFWIIDTNGNLYIASQTYSKDKENLLR
jgi:hypothetical protein